jgi:hypothetical protein
MSDTETSPQPQGHPSAATTTTQSSQQTDNSEQSISATKLKLPSYWTNDPTLWFLQVEARFRTHQVRSDRRQFDHIVDSLPQDVLFEVRDFLVTPPAANAYTALKAAILSRTYVGYSHLKSLVTGNPLNCYVI